MNNIKHKNQRIQGHGNGSKSRQYEQTEKALRESEEKFRKNIRQARIEFGRTTENGTKTFFIKDNGAGFDMAFKDKLFGAFQRLVEAHHGRIWAESTAGKGTTIKFTLPLIS